MDAIGVTAGIGITATAGTATVRIGPATESSAAKSAGARCGAQGTFAVDGYIETLALKGGGLRLIPNLFGRPSTSHASPLPWSAKRNPGGYVVKDATGQALAYVYARETKADADIAKVLTMGEAWRVASNTAKLLYTPPRRGRVGCPGRIAC